MAKSKVNLSSSNLLTALFYGVIGVLLMIWKGGSLNILMTIVGAMLIVLGVIDIFKNKDTVKGLIEVGAGIAIIILGWLIVDVVLLVLGIFLIVKGVLEIVKIYKNGFMAMLSPLVTIVIGILLVISKWALLDTICFIAGVFFVINAVLVLLGKPIIKKKK